MLLQQYSMPRMIPMCRMCTRLDISFVTGAHQNLLLYASVPTLPGIVILPAESLTFFRHVTEIFRRNVKIKICFSAIHGDEDNFTLVKFFEHSEEPCAQHHLLNVIDFNGDSYSGLVHRFTLRNIGTDITFGHCMKASLSPQNQSAFDFTSGISDYLLMSEAGVQTKRHQDFTGIIFFYIFVEGKKHFFVVEQTEENRKLL